jgi:hypothetical protein
MAAGKRWGSPDTASPQKGLYSKAYCDARDAVTAQIEALRCANTCSLQRLVVMARTLHRKVYEAEKRRVRGDG